MPSIYLLAMSSFISLLIGSLVILFTNAVIRVFDDRRTIFSLLLTCRKSKIGNTIVRTISVNVVNSRLVVRVLQERLSYKAMDRVCLTLILNALISVCRRISISPVHLETGDTAVVRNEHRAVFSAKNPSLLMHLRH